MVELIDSALTTLAAIEGETGLDTSEAPDFFKRRVNVATHLVESITDRKWHHVEDFQERVAAYGDYELRVRKHLPLVSISSIEYGAKASDLEEIEADSYTIFEGAEKHGVITRLDQRWRDTRVVDRSGYSNRMIPDTEKPLYLVTYTGGYITPHQVDEGLYVDRDLPWDVEQAVIDYCAMQYHQRGTDPTVAAESMDMGSITYVLVDGQRVMVPASMARLASKRLLVIA